MMLILLITLKFNSALSGQMINSNDNSFLLTGKLIGNYNGYGYMYLISYDDQNKRIVDSCNLLNGEFHFKGVINGFSDEFYLKLDKEMRLNNDSVNSVNIYLDNSIINITLIYDHFSQFKMSGCHSYDELEKYENKKSVLQKKIDNYDSMLSKNINLKVNKTRLNIAEKQMITMDKNYCKANPNSSISPYLLYWLKNKIDKKEYKNYSLLYYNLSHKQQNSFYGKKTNYQIEENFKITNSVGRKAPIFSGIDLDGKEIHLDSIYENKYVLLDFWASWCIPCREENKHLKNIYERYSAQGFEIISISSDANVSDWRKAIYSDSIQNWKHILSDSSSIKKRKGIDGSSYNEYYIQSLPTKILINKKGEIIGRYDFSENNILEKQLSEFFLN